jgi:hypothetical protein
VNEPLKNWKTILGCIAIGGLSLVLKLDWITLDVWTWCIAIVGPMTGISMRLGMGTRR